MYSKSEVRKEVYFVTEKRQQNVNSYIFCSPNDIIGAYTCYRTFFILVPFFAYEFIVSKLNILVQAWVKNFRHFDNPRTLPRLSFVIKLNIFLVPPSLYTSPCCFSLCTPMFRNFEIPTQNLKKVCR